MALNAASHNPTGEATGPISGQPPPPSAETKAAILDAANGDPKGHNAPGQDGGDQNAAPKAKSEKELAKERAKAEKAAKFAAKQEKSQKLAASSQPKTQSAKAMKKPTSSSTTTISEPHVEDTPPGDKKLLKPIAAAYNPTAVESAWYAWWEKIGIHEPEYIDGEVKPAGSFVISIPPPNVTGKLHIGHALATSLQDCLIRWNRMKGKTVLYVPGCDHAGISTQSVVENMLWNREQKTRHDLGRPKFVERTWEWKEEYHASINKTLKRMGGSMDWTREGFTMSETLSKAVRQTFVQLHDEGLIYRDNKLVNWDSQMSTSVSNLEVDQKELAGPTKIDVPGYDKKIEFGCIWNFKYPIDGSEGETIEVATTRPETLLGDSGVAVHPEDERYKHLLGKNVKHPFVDRLLPIFGDETVERDFGTGAVKITPAHDQNDFKRGKEHGLEFINILNDDGTMNSNAGPFEGHKRFDVRYTIITELEKKGLYVGKKPNPMNVPLSSKSKDVIEPRLRPQWWMEMKSLAEPAIDAVKDGRIKIIPENSEQTYYRWMESIGDWCLSRQLWWGHRIPAWFVVIKDGPAYDSEANHWICAQTEEEARTKAEKKFPGKEFELEQDPDCLDTWFSAGLWPFSTLGWPEKTLDFEKLYPTSMLETGWDILFFWVARMIMFGLKMTGEVPFTEVYCHSLVRDSEGRKMSKSLGNVIDPVDIMDGISLEALNEKLKTGNLAPREVERATKWQKSAFPDGIDECGADALRFSLINYTTGGGDISFDVKVMRATRNFCNKIFQATKFVLGSLPSDYTPPAKGGKTGKESLPERWILHKLNAAARKINDALESREFSRATQAAHQYWLYELCDVYIENSKSIIRDGTAEESKSAQDTLYTALESGLQLMAPFMPFLTEEKWQRLPRRPGDDKISIHVKAYPEPDPQLHDEESERAYELVLDCSKGIRALLQEYSIREGGRAFIRCTEEAFKIASAQQAAIKTLGYQKSRGEVAILSPSEAVPKGCAVYPISADLAAYVEIQGDVDPEKEIKRLRPKMSKAADAVREQEKLVAGIGQEVKGEIREGAERTLRDLLGVQSSYEESLGAMEALKLR